MSAADDAYTLTSRSANAYGIYSDGPLTVKSGAVSGHSAANHTGVIASDATVSGSAITTIEVSFAEEIGENSFTDVPEGPWYTDAIAWAKQSEIVRGYSETIFGTNEPVTRAQLAAILHRFIVKNELVEGITPTGLMGWIDPKRVDAPNIVA